MSAELAWNVRDSPLGITIEEYEVMDEGTCRGIEIVDGWPVSRPSPSLEHQAIMINLCSALKLADRTSKGMLRPNEILLAVEIMSPGTISTDRYTKPGEYAEADIPFYWRFEQRAELELHAYELVPGRPLYRLAGVHTGRYVTTKPFELNLDIQSLHED